MVPGNQKIMRAEQNLGVGKRSSTRLRVDVRAMVSRGGLKRCCYFLYEERAERAKKKLARVQQK